MIEAIAVTTAGLALVVIALAALINGSDKAYERRHQKADLMAEAMAWRDGKTRMEYLRDLRRHIQHSYGINSEPPDSNDCMTMSLRLNLGGDKPFRATVECLEDHGFLLSIHEEVKNDRTR